MRLVVADEVAHVLKQEVAWSVEVSIGQVCHDHAVLHHAPGACNCKGTSQGISCSMCCNDVSLSAEGHSHLR